MARWPDEADNSSSNRDVVRRCTFFVRVSATKWAPFVMSGRVTGSHYVVMTASVVDTDLTNTSPLGEAEHEKGGV